MEMREREAVSLSWVTIPTVSIVTGAYRGNATSSARLLILLSLIPPRCPQRPSTAQVRICSPRTLSTRPLTTHRQSRSTRAWTCSRARSQAWRPSPWAFRSTRVSARRRRRRPPHARSPPPACTVKVRLQTPLVARRYASAWHAFATIVREERVRGLFRGIASPLVRLLPARRAEENAECRGDSSPSRRSTASSSRPTASSSSSSSTTPPQRPRSHRSPSPASPAASSPRTPPPSLPPRPR